MGNASKYRVMQNWPRSSSPKLSWRPPYLLPQVKVKVTRKGDKRKSENKISKLDYLYYFMAKKQNTGTVFIKNTKNMKLDDTLHVHRYLDATEIT